MPGEVCDGVPAWIEHVIVLRQHADQSRFSGRQEFAGRVAGIRFAANRCFADSLGASRFCEESDLYGRGTAFGVETLGFERVRALPGDQAGKTVGAGPVRLEFSILSLNPGLAQRCVAPDIWPTLFRA